MIVADGDGPGVVIPAAEALRERGERELELRRLVEPERRVVPGARLSHQRRERRELPPSGRPHAHALERAVLFQGGAQLRVRVEPALTLGEAGEMLAPDGGTVLRRCARVDDEQSLGAEHARHFCQEPVPAKMMNGVERGYDVARPVGDRQRFRERRDAGPLSVLERPSSNGAPQHSGACVRADRTSGQDATLAQRRTHGLEISAGAGAHVEEAQGTTVCSEPGDHAHDPPHGADVEVAHASVACRDTAKVVDQGGGRHGPNYTYSMPSLPSRLARHVGRARLFPEPGTAVVAVSGGADSVALLDLLHGLAPTLGLTLLVAHADHGIASDSRAVGHSVRELAERLGLPFELGELRLGSDATETTARRARYAWLREVQGRRGARYLVTAHHQDDQIETIVLRLLRGSAPAGLAGIAARARGGLVRPLLPFTKRELVAHTASRGLPVHEDPANSDPRHLRSWIRTVLLPLIVGRLGTRVGDDVRRAGQAAALERRAWDHALEHLPALELRVEARGFDVARAGLARYDDSLSAALLRAAARRAGLVLGVRRARRLLALARRPSGRRLSLGSDWWAEVAFDRLRVQSREVEEVREVVEVGEEKERGRAEFGAFHVEWSSEPAPERLARGDWTTWIGGGGDWEVRPARPGDRLVPLGGVGRRPVRRMLMEARVPRGDRAGYPVVARGETILWVPGICRSAADLPRPGTRAVRVDVTKHGEPQADRRA